MNPNLDRLQSYPFEKPRDLYAAGVEECHAAARRMEAFCQSL
jgi:hypothetical protein